MRPTKTAGLIITVLLPLVIVCGNAWAQTPETELENLRQSAEQGDAEAQNKLGMMYANGQGVEKDAREAVRWYQRAADQGLATAQVNLGWMYDTGEGVEKNDREAAQWYRRAADQGDAKAQFNLGVMYANGEGVEKNDREAAQWYRRAADQGDADAQFNLGLMYDTGIGVEKDAREAAQWYRRAADQGFTKAQFNLGVMYANGEGVEKNDREAAQWYRRAADQGFTKAQFNLGVMYANGEGVEKNDREAAQWYRRAADQGDADAQNNLGVMYDNGIGVEKDAREAAQWYRRAADQGSTKAQFNLGVMYANGEGVEKNDREAAQWYRRAADQGDADAQNNLGLMYATGRGVIQDDREAYIWLSLAAVQETATAKTRDKVAGRLSPSERRAAQAEARRRLKAIDAGRAESTDKWMPYAQSPLTSVSPPSQQPSAAQTAFEHGWRSVVVITTSDAQGSGVIVRPNVVATNCHVVDDGGEIVVYKADNRRAQTDTPHRAAIRHADDERDLCLLDVSALWGIPAQIRKAGSLSIGEAVYAIGTPQGLEYSLSAGVVSQLRRDEDGAPVIQTDAAVSPGSSGGGLFDAEGYLVGITTQKISDGEITFAVPAEWILDMP